MHLPEQGASQPIFAVCDGVGRSARRTGVRSRYHASEALPGNTTPGIKPRRRSLGPEVERFDASR